MDEKVVNNLPNLFPDRNKALVVTAINPNSPQGGSSNLMRNFLMQFNPESYLIATSKCRGKKRTHHLPTVICLTDYYKFRKPVRLIFGRLFKEIDAFRLKKAIKENNIKNVLIIYPHLYNIEVFFKINPSKKLNITAYFHDTFIEGQSGKIHQKKLESYHKKILAKVKLLFVMNEGMRKLYIDKYHCNTISLEHIYPEYSITGLKQNEKTREGFFWGGNIVGYNAASLYRLVDGAKKIECQVEIASRQSKNTISKYLPQDNIKKTFYSDREEYLNALKNSKFLLLALNWPDETDYHVDEIATIFSTKAIEYFTSGVPIILHAPKDYFLSEFILKNECGYVICTREQNEFETKFNEILNYKKHSKVVDNAYKVAATFEPKRIIDKWLVEVKDLV